MSSVILRTFFLTIPDSLEESAKIDGANDFTILFRIMVTSAQSGDITSELAENVKYATIVIATVPILCVYPFLQRYFVKGVMIGAVKG